MRNPFQLSILASAVVLAGCGGGGGGPGGSNVNTGTSYLRSSVSYATPTQVNHYTPLTGTGVNAVVADVFVKDLNNDNVEEVVVGGRQTQPATPATWRNTNMQLYGWNTGSFSNETSTWFSGTDNEIVGSEPSIKFGDFDGDGNVDMFVAPSTDMNTLYADPLVFRNTGADSFTRSTINTGGDDWTHDSWVGDLNGDGRDDIVMSNIGGTNRIVVNYGNADGTFETHTGTVGGSGISIADYLGDGSMTIVLTDAPTSVQSDTKLYSFSTAGGTVTLTEVATLPASYFYNGNFTAEVAVAFAPHEIRNFSMDFNNDGTMDVVVMSNLSGGGVNMSALQFLRNDGAGVFTDVTDSVLVDYDHDTQASYQPILIDINNDGLDDILLSSSDDVSETGYHDSTRVLVQTSDGKFVQKYEDVFKEFYNQIHDATANALDWGQPINIVVGPGGEKYLFSTVMYTDSGNVQARTYLAKIGTTGTITAQTAADVINANWPYLSAVTVNEVLAQTAPLSINGVEVVDLDLALQPVDGLGIVTDGTTSRITISGNISIPGFSNGLLSNVQAVDGLGRNYRVDMSVMGADVNPVFNIEPVGQATQPWASRYLTTNYTAQGVWAIGDSDQYSVATNSTILNTDWNYSFSHTQMQASPWMAFNGVFGSIENTSTLEANISKTYTNGVWHQFGVLNTKTEFTPGLITDVSDISAVYSVMGYRDNEWSVQTGVEPVIVGGSLNLRLPTAVDNSGNLLYNDYNVNVRNDAQYFVNATRTFTSKLGNVYVNASTTSNGNNAASITFETKL